MFDSEKRAELIRPKMMIDGKYLVTRIGGSIQEADPNKILDMYFRYKNYISGDNEFEIEWLKTSLKEVWSTRFIGLVENFWSRPVSEIKKLEYQNPPYSAANAFGGRRKEPRDYNKVFAVQLSGCTYSCNFCYVPSEINLANPTLGKFFSQKEIVNYFLTARSKSKEPMNVIRITGGEPTVIPEIIVDIYTEIERRGLEIYLWIDTNLSMTKYLERIESDLKNIMQRRNVGVVGCFKGFCKESFSMLTGSKPEFYEKQFETAKLFLDWKTDFYVYLPALVYENPEQKIKAFVERLRELNKNLPLRVEMLIIKDYPGAVINIQEKTKQGRPMPQIDQKIVFDLWYNKLLPKYYSKELLSKFCCEIPL
jgi:uncharacterized Fe-S cluster-containing radical SAM superfamily protein